ncbi:MAG TPA: hypothetical protein PL000_23230, partial [Anaerolineales bacterium]|nr:hypothetical protein [Anaerolineales bacterium]
ESSGKIAFVMPHHEKSAGAPRKLPVSVILFRPSLTVTAHHTDVGISYITVIKIHRHQNLPTVITSIIDIDLCWHAYCFRDAGNLAY